MTSEQIKSMIPEHVGGHHETEDGSWISYWLKEIAYQLAVMNERENRKAYPLLKRDESGNIVEVQP